jgi:protein O-GlcNAc transferase
MDYDLILSLIEGGDLTKAENILRQILKKNKSDFNSLILLSEVYRKTDNLHEATKLLFRAHLIQPQNINLLNRLSQFYYQTGRPDQAISTLKKALQLQPDTIEIKVNLANIYANLENYSETINYCLSAIECDPKFLPAYLLCHDSFIQSGEKVEAEKLINQAIELMPDEAQLYISRAQLYEKQSRYADALNDLNTARNFGLNTSDMNLREANIHFKSQNYYKAISFYSEAISLNAKNSEAYIGKANCLYKLNKRNESFEFYNFAGELDQNCQNAHIGKAIIYNDRYLLRESLQEYEQAQKLSQEVGFLVETTTFIKQKLCDWTTINQDKEILIAKINKNKILKNALSTLSISDDETLNKNAALNYVISNFSPDIKKRLTYLHKENKKIKIGYFSSDFYNHATSHLIANVIELHDRSQFEIYGFSFGSAPEDNYRKRLISAFDYFFDITSLSDDESAQFVREKKIDIALDLKGLTKDHRLGIFMSQAAPIQINYLGFPGSLGVNYFDYIIADKIVIPENNKEIFCEKIIYMPDSYQPNDPEKIISEEIFYRKDYGLPNEAFVFCCFNNSYKILPQTFNLWLGILKETPNSVLWLLEDNEEANRNLKFYASQHGVDEKRIIFAPRELLPKHLGRHQLADLFLDTLPYCAHTTASDALFAGLPLLTLVGKTFAGRVAASLLSACNLDELITRTPSTFKERALYFYRNAAELRNIRKKLQDNISNLALFNSKKYTRNLESAFIKIYEKRLMNEPNDHIILS